MMVQFVMQARDLRKGDVVARYFEQTQTTDYGTVEETEWWYDDGYGVWLDSPRWDERSNTQRGPDFTVEDPERMLVVLRRV